MREVEMGNDGAIWVLEDGPSGRVISCTKPKEETEADVAFGINNRPSIN